MEGVVKIIKKGMPVFAKRTKVSELDINKCSRKFIAVNLPKDEYVYVKCHEDGTLDMRGNKSEYRIIPSDVILI